EEEDKEKKGRKEAKGKKNNKHISSRSKAKKSKSKRITKSSAADSIFSAFKVADFTIKEGEVTNPILSSSSSSSSAGGKAGFWRALLGEVEAKRREEERLAHEEKMNARQKRKDAMFLKVPKYDYDNAEDNDVFTMNEENAKQEEENERKDAEALKKQALMTKESDVERKTSRTTIIQPSSSAIQAQKKMDLVSTGLVQAQARPNEPSKVSSAQQLKIAMQQNYLKSLEKINTIMTPAHRIVLLQLSICVCRFQQLSSVWTHLQSFHFNGLLGTEAKVLKVYKPEILSFVSSRLLENISDIIHGKVTQSMVQCGVFPTNKWPVEPLYFTIPLYQIVLAVRQTTVMDRVRIMFRSSLSDADYRTVFPLTCPSMTTSKTSSSWIKQMHAWSIKGRELAETKQGRRSLYDPEIWPKLKYFIHSKDLLYKIWINRKGLSLSLISRHTDPAVEAVIRVHLSILEERKAKLDSHLVEYETWVREHPKAPPSESPSHPSRENIQRISSEIRMWSILCDVAKTSGDAWFVDKDKNLWDMRLLIGLFRYYSPNGLLQTLSMVCDDVTLGIGSAALVKEQYTMFLKWREDIHMKQALVAKKQEKGETLTSEDEMILSNLWDMRLLIGLFRYYSPNGLLPTLSMVCDDVTLGIGSAALVKEQYTMFLKWREDIHMKQALVAKKQEKGETLTSEDEMILSVNTSQYPSHILTIKDKIKVEDLAKSLFGHTQALLNLIYVLTNQQPQL
ncbi:hypothetical protein ADUPG1_007193, partial [Aduncisulcus paluster]